MSRWRRYVLVGAGVFVFLLGGFLVGGEIHRTGRVWPSVRSVIVSLSILSAFFFVIGFYKLRRGGATLLSAAGLVALLTGIWWTVPDERGLVLSFSRMATEIVAGGLVFVPAVYGRIPAALGAAGGLLGGLYGIGLTFPALPGPARALLDAGIEGVWLGSLGFVLYGAGRAGFLTLPGNDAAGEARRPSAD